MTSSATLNAETDARFWAQTNYKPGHKLDPKNPTDASMIPVWKDIYQKVKGEADAGTLVKTYDHPAVAQAISDSALAHDVASAHMDAAAAAPDAAGAQDHVAAATTAQQVSAQRALDAAASQPPSASASIVAHAAQQVSGNPPPPRAPASEHLAHANVQHHAHAHVEAAHHAARATQDAALRRLYAIADQRFWSSTHYKPGEKLSLSDPRDVEMAKVWMRIFHQVQREAAEGTLAASPPTSGPAAPAPPPAPAPTAPPVPPPAQAAPQPYPPAARPPMPPPMPPPFAPPHGRGHHGWGGAPPSPAPTPTLPPQGSVAPAAPAAPEGPPGGPPEMSPPAPPSPGGLSGSKIAVVLGLVAAGGAAYMLHSRRGGSPAPRTRSRARAPRFPVPGSGT